MKKDFEWQYSDEKLLFKSHEHILSFFLDKTHVFAVYIVFSLLVGGVVGFVFHSSLAGVLVTGIIFAIYVLYMYTLYKNTWLIVSSRRILELTQNGFFKKHRRELKLMDIKATESERSVFETMLWVSRLTIKGTEEDANIYFKWIPGGSDVANYIGRVIDYLKLNKHTDEISRYVSKKERKK